MVDFRYHVVSIIAIFLALAIGIVVGATALNGGVVHDLNNRVHTLLTDRGNLRTRNADLQQQVNSGQAALGALLPRELPGRLADRKIAVVLVPGASSDLRDSVTGTLTTAGAKVTTVLRLTDKFVDPREEPVLDDLVSTLPLPPHVTLPSGSAIARAGTLLVGAVGTSNGEVQRSILHGFSGAGLIDTVTEGAPADLAVLLVGDPPSTPSTPDPLPAAVRDLAHSFGTAMSTVVAGPRTAATDPGGLLAAVRADSATDGVIGSIDTVDEPTGQLALVLALQNAPTGLHLPVTPTPAASTTPAASPSGTPAPGHALGDYGTTSGVAPLPTPVP